MSFGKNLKELREEKGLTQGDFAQMIGMYPTHLSRYERERSTPSIDVLKKMAEALEVPVDRLIFGAEEEQVKKNINDPELLRMFKKVQELGDDDVHCVKSLLEAYLFKSELKEKLA